MVLGSAKPMVEPKQKKQREAVNSRMCAAGRGGARGVVRGVRQVRGMRGFRGVVKEGAFVLKGTVYEGSSAP
eukprot:1182031-Prorocentrum_minimum.AAC.3